MKTLLFCNLIPLKTGAYEALLATIGREFQKAGDEYVVVFAGEPIPPVAKSLRAANVRWRILPGWVRANQGRGNDLTRSREASEEEMCMSADCGENKSPFAPSRLRVKYSSSERIRPWAFVLPALRIIREERPDVVAVHFGNELPTLATSLLCKLTMRRPPHWIWEQDQQIQDPGQIARRLSKLRLLGLGVDRFLAVYEGGRQSMLKRGIPDGKITVIHNSVAPYAPTREKGWLRQEFGIGADEVILVTNGSLILRKRIDFILRVCSELEEIKEESTSREAAKPRTEEGDVSAAGGNNIFPFASSRLRVRQSFSWRLLIIGEGPERESLGALAASLGIAERVHFLGLRNDVREILPECDIYLHASRAETCTYAITESMAAGIPAVVLIAGAAREQIEPGVSGYVFEGEDLESYSGAIQNLARDMAAREEMGRVAANRWRTHFTVERAATSCKQLYTELSAS
jgi:glycosyltransferase involved in cell wall biosynthesis